MTLKKTLRWQKNFITSLCETGNVTESCRQANIARNTAYRHREENPEFAAAWDEAIEVATDALELEARRRAIHGVDEPVFHRGEEIGTVRKYSDTLLIFLLKAHKPEKFRERTEITGKDGGPIRTEDVGLTDAERLAKLAAIFDGARTRNGGQVAGGSASTPDAT